MKYRHFRPTWVPSKYKILLHPSNADTSTLFFYSANEWSLTSLNGILAACYLFHAILNKWLRNSISPEAQKQTSLGSSIINFLSWAEQQCENKEDSVKNRLIIYKMMPTQDTINE